MSSSRATSQNLLVYGSAPADDLESFITLLEH